MHKNMSKLYVLVRRDLNSKGDQAVQAGHAAIKFIQCTYSKYMNWDNTLVYLYVKNEMALLDFINDVLGSNEIPFEMFEEPDMDGEVTAVATMTDRSELFKGLRLM